MQEDAAKRNKEGDGGNAYIGAPGTDFLNSEIALFLRADKNFDRLDIPDSVGKNQKLRFNERYYEWKRAGKPVRRGCAGSAVGRKLFGGHGGDYMIPTAKKCVFPPLKKAFFCRAGYTPIILNNCAIIFATPFLEMR